MPTQWAGPPSRVEPGPGQESVWDYPRPPRVEPATRRMRVVFGGELVVDTTRAVRVLETAGAPCYYAPPDEVRMDLLVPNRSRTECEWKGTASYYDLRVGEEVAPRAAWTYPEPKPGYESIAGWIAFYPGRVDEAWLDDERATPQPGTFYGGWVTAEVVGPFKGEPGSAGW